MRVVLELPAAWTSEPLDDGGWRATGPGDLVLTASPLAIRPDNLVLWANAVVRQGVPDGVVGIIAEKNETTAVGWPVHWVEIEVAAPRPRRRLFGFYHFLDYAGHVVVEHAAGAADAAAPLREQLALLLTARADFTTDDVVALAELWA